MYCAEQWALCIRTYTIVLTSMIDFPPLVPDLTWRAIIKLTNNRTAPDQVTIYNAFIKINKIIFSCPLPKARPPMFAALVAAWSLGLGQIGLPAF